MPTLEEQNNLYTYTINQKLITGAWKQINNAVDSDTYTEPENFT